MRVRPPLILLAWKKVPPQGDTLDGKFVPGGTNIGQNTWSMMRRTDIFGQDVDVFRPERWLEAEPARLADMTRTVDLVFGYGRWTCAGKHVAFVELNMTVVEVRVASSWGWLEPPVVCWPSVADST
jgi:cytochrome P450